jgi:hypothetical protein
MPLRKVSQVSTYILLNWVLELDRRFGTSPDLHQHTSTLKNLLDVPYLDNAWKLVMLEIKWRGLRHLYQYLQEFSTCSGFLPDSAEKLYESIYPSRPGIETCLCKRQSSFAAITYRNHQPLNPFQRDTVSTTRGVTSLCLHLYIITFHESRPTSLYYYML